MEDRRLIYIEFKEFKNLLVKKALNNGFEECEVDFAKIYEYISFLYEEDDV